MGASVVVSTVGSVVVGKTPFVVVPSVAAVVFSAGEVEVVVGLSTGPDGVVVSAFSVVEVTTFPGVVSTLTGAPGVVSADTGAPGVVVSTDTEVVVSDDEVVDGASTGSHLAQQSPSILTAFSLTRHAGVLHSFMWHSVLLLMHMQVPHPSADSHLSPLLYTWSMYTQGQSSSATQLCPSYMVPAGQAHPDTHDDVTVARQLSLMWGHTFEHKLAHSS